MRSWFRVLLSITFLPLVLLCFCGHDSPVAPTQAEISTLELLPLAQGTRWRYRYFHMSEDYLVNSLGSRRTITRLFGELDLEVTSGEANVFFGHYHLLAKFSPDSLITEDYERSGVFTTSTNYEVPEARREYDLALDSDTLWYESNGKREYMMPRGFSPGGEINLRLFELPGTSFFDSYLGSAQEVNTGEFLYQTATPGIGTVVRILRNVGVKGLIAEKAIGERTLESNWHEEDLIYNLLLKDPGQIYEVPSRTYW